MFQNLENNYNSNYKLLWDLAACFGLDSRETRESCENYRRERTEAAAKHMEINQIFFI